MSNRFIEYGKMDDYTTRLRMLPVCSCGYVFTKGVIIYEDIIEEEGFNYAKYSIEPPICPQCNKEIECIEHNDYIYKRIF